MTGKRKANRWLAFLLSLVLVAGSVMPASAASLDPGFDNEIDAVETQESQDTPDAVGAQGAEADADTGDKSPGGSASGADSSSAASEEDEEDGVIESEAVSETDGEESAAEKTGDDEDAPKSFESGITRNSAGAGEKTITITLDADEAYVKYTAPAEDADKGIVGISVGETGAVSGQSAKAGSYVLTYNAGAGNYSVANLSSVLHGIFTGLETPSGNTAVVGLEDTTEGNSGALIKDAAALTTALGNNANPTFKLISTIPVTVKATAADIGDNVGDLVVTIPNSENYVELNAASGVVGATTNAGTTNTYTITFSAKMNEEAIFTALKTYFALKTPSSCGKIKTLDFNYTDDTENVVVTAENFEDAAAAASGITVELHDILTITVPNVSAGHNANYGNLIWNGEDAKVSETSVVGEGKVIKKIISTPKSVEDDLGTPEVDETAYVEAGDSVVHGSYVIEYDSAQIGSNGTALLAAVNALFTFNAPYDKLIKIEFQSDSKAILADTTENAATAGKAALTDVLADNSNVPTVDITVPTLVLTATPGEASVTVSGGIVNYTATMQSNSSDLAENALPTGCNYVFVNKTVNNDYDDLGDTEIDATWTKKSDAAYDSDLTNYKATASVKLTPKLEASDNTSIGTVYLGYTDDGGSTYTPVLIDGSMVYKTIKYNTTNATTVVVKDGADASGKTLVDWANVSFKYSTKKSALGDPSADGYAAKLAALDAEQETLIANGIYSYQGHAWEGATPGYVEFVIYDAVPSENGVALDGAAKTTAEKAAVKKTLDYIASEKLIPSSNDLFEVKYAYEKISAEATTSSFDSYADFNSNGEATVTTEQAPITATLTPTYVSGGAVTTDDGNLVNVAALGDGVKIRFNAKLATKALGTEGMTWTVTENDSADKIKLYKDEELKTLWSETDNKHTIAASDEADSIADEEGNLTFYVAPLKKGTVNFTIGLKKSSTVIDLIPDDAADTYDFTMTIIDDPANQGKFVVTTGADDTLKELKGVKETGGDAAQIEFQRFGTDGVANWTAEGQEISYYTANGSGAPTPSAAIKPLLNETIAVSFKNKAGGVIKGAKDLEVTATSSDANVIKVKEEDGDNDGATASASITISAEGGADNVKFRLVAQDIKKGHDTATITISAEGYEDRVFKVSVDQYYKITLTDCAISQSATVATGAKDAYDVFKVVPYFKGGSKLYSGVAAPVAELAKSDTTNFYSTIVTGYAPSIIQKTTNGTSNTSKTDSAAYFEGDDNYFLKGDETWGIMFNRIEQPEVTKITITPAGGSEADAVVVYNANGPIDSASYKLRNVGGNGYGWYTAQDTEYNQAYKATVKVEATGMLEGDKISLRQGSAGFRITDEGAADKTQATAYKETTDAQIGTTTITSGTGTASFIVYQIADGALAAIDSPVTFTADVTSGYTGTFGIGSTREYIATAIADSAIEGKGGTALAVYSSSANNYNRSVLIEDGETLSSVADKLTATLVEGDGKIYTAASNPDHKVISDWELSAAYDGVSENTSLYEASLKDKIPSVVESDLDVYPVESTEEFTVDFVLDDSIADLSYISAKESGAAVVGTFVDGGKTIANTTITKLKAPDPIPVPYGNVLGVGVSTTGVTRVESMPATASGWAWGAYTKDESGNRKEYIFNNDERRVYAAADDKPDVTGTEITKDTTIYLTLRTDVEAIGITPVVTALADANGMDEFYNAAKGAQAGSIWKHNTQEKYYIPVEYGKTVPAAILNPGLVPADSVTTKPVYRAWTYGGSGEYDLDADTIIDFNVVNTATPDFTAGYDYTITLVNDTTEANKVSSGIFKNEGVDTVEYVVKADDDAYNDMRQGIINSLFALLNNPVEVGGKTYIAKIYEPKTVENVDVADTTKEVVSGTAGSNQSKLVANKSQTLYVLYAEAGADTITSVESNLGGNEVVAEWPMKDSASDITVPLSVKLWAGDSLATGTPEVTWTSDNENYVYFNSNAISATSDAAGGVAAIDAKIKWSRDGYWGKDVTHTVTAQIAGGASMTFTIKLKRSYSVSILPATSATKGQLSNVKSNIDFFDGLELGANEDSWSLNDGYVFEFEDDDEGNAPTLLEVLDALEAFDKKASDKNYVASDDLYAEAYDGETDKNSFLGLKLESAYSYRDGNNTIIISDTTHTLRGLVDSADYSEFYGAYLDGSLVLQPVFDEVYTLTLEKAPGAPSTLTIPDYFKTTKVAKDTALNTYLGTTIGLDAEMLGIEALEEEGWAPYYFIKKNVGTEEKPVYEDRELSDSTVMTGNLTVYVTASRRLYISAIPGEAPTLSNIGVEFGQKTVSGSPVDIRILDSNEDPIAASADANYQTDNASDSIKVIYGKTFAEAGLPGDYTTAASRLEDGSKASPNGALKSSSGELFAGWYEITATSQATGKNTYSAAIPVSTTVANENTINGDMVLYERWYAPITIRTRTSTESSGKGAEIFTPIEGADAAHQYDSAWFSKKASGNDTTGYTNTIDLATKLVFLGDVIGEGKLPAGSILTKYPVIASGKYYEFKTWVPEAQVATEYSAADAAQYGVTKDSALGSKLTLVGMYEEKTREFTITIPASEGKHYTFTGLGMQAGGSATTAATIKVTGGSNLSTAIATALTYITVEDGYKFENSSAHFASPEDVLYYELDVTTIATIEAAGEAAEEAATNAGKSAAEIEAAGKAAREAAEKILTKDTAIADSTTQKVYNNITLVPQIVKDGATVKVSIDGGFTTWKDGSIADATTNFTKNDDGTLSFTLPYGASAGATEITNKTLTTLKNALKATEEIDGDKWDFWGFEYDTTDSAGEVEKHYLKYESSSSCKITLNQMGYKAETELYNLNVVFTPSKLSLILFDGEGSWVEPKTSEKTVKGANLTYTFSDGQWSVSVPEAASASDTSRVVVNASDPSKYTITFTEADIAEMNALPGTMGAWKITAPANQQWYRWELISSDGNDESNKTLSTATGTKNTKIWNQNFNKVIEPVYGGESYDVKFDMGELSKKFADDSSDAYTTLKTKFTDSEIKNQAKNSKLGTQVTFAGGDNYSYFDNLVDADLSYRGWELDGWYYEDANGIQHPVEMASNGATISAGKITSGSVIAPVVKADMVKDNILTLKAYWARNIYVADDLQVLGDGYGPYMTDEEAEILGTSYKYARVRYGDPITANTFIQEDIDSVEAAGSFALKGWQKVVGAGEPAAVKFGTAAGSLNTADETLASTAGEVWLTADWYTLITFDASATPYAADAETKNLWSADVASTALDGTTTTPARTVATRTARVELGTDLTSLLTSWKSKLDVTNRSKCAGFFTSETGGNAPTIITADISPLTLYALFPTKDQQLTVNLTIDKNGAWKSGIEPAAITYILMDDTKTVADLAKEELLDYLAKDETDDSIIIGKTPIYTLKGFTVGTGTTVYPVDSSTTLKTLTANTSGILNIKAVYEVTRVALKFQLSNTADLVAVDAEGLTATQKKIRAEIAASGDSKTATLYRTKNDTTCSITEDELADYAAVLVDYKAAGSLFLDETKWSIAGTSADRASSYTIPATNAVISPVYVTPTIKATLVDETGAVVAEETTAATTPADMAIKTTAKGRSEWVTGTTAETALVSVPNGKGLRYNLNVTPAKAAQFVKTTITVEGAAAFTPMDGKTKEQTIAAVWDTETKNVAKVKAYDPADVNRYKLTAAFSMDTTTVTFSGFTTVSVVTGEKFKAVMNTTDAFNNAKTKAGMGGEGGLVVVVNDYTGKTYAGKNIATLADLAIQPLTGSQVNGIRSVNDYTGTFRWATEGRSLAKDVQLKNYNGSAATIDVDMEYVNGNEVTSFVQPVTFVTASYTVDWEKGGSFSDVDFLEAKLDKEGNIDSLPMLYKLNVHYAAPAAVLVELKKNVGSYNNITAEYGVEDGNVGTIQKSAWSITTSKVKSNDPFEIRQYNDGTFSLGLVKSLVAAKSYSKRQSFKVNVVSGDGNYKLVANTVVTTGANGLTLSEGNIRKETLYVTPFGGALTDVSTDTNFTDNFKLDGFDGKTYAYANLTDHLGMIRLHGTIEGGIAQNLALKGTADKPKIKLTVSSDNTGVIGVAGTGDLKKMNVQAAGNPVYTAETGENATDYYFDVYLKAGGKSGQAVVSIKNNDDNASEIRIVFNVFDAATVFTGTSATFDSTKAIYNVNSNVTEDNRKIEGVISTVTQNFPGGHTVKVSDYTYKSNVTGLTPVSGSDKAVVDANSLKWSQSFSSATKNQTPNIIPVVTDSWMDTTGQLKVPNVLKFSLKVNTKAPSAAVKVTTTPNLAYKNPVTAIELTGTDSIDSVELLNYTMADKAKTVVSLSDSDHKNDLGLWGVSNTPSIQAGHLGNLSQNVYATKKTVYMTMKDFAKGAETANKADFPAKATIRVHFNSAQYGDKDPVSYADYTVNLSYRNVLPTFKLSQKNFTLYPNMLITGGSFKLTMSTKAGEWPVDANNTGATIAFSSAVKDVVKTQLAISGDIFKAGTDGQLSDTFDASGYVKDNGFAEMPLRFDAPVGTTVSFQKTISKAIIYKDENYRGVDLGISIAANYKTTPKKFYTIKAVTMNSTLVDEDGKLLDKGSADVMVYNGVFANLEKLTVTPAKNNTAGKSLNVYFDKTEVEGEYAKLRVRFGETAPKKGSYTYDVTGYISGTSYQLTQTFSVKVVDTAVEDSVVIKKAGSLDVFNKGGKYLTCTVTFPGFAAGKSLDNVEFVDSELNNTFDINLLNKDSFIISLKGNARNVFSKKGSDLYVKLTVKDEDNDTFTITPSAKKGQSTLKGIKVTQPNPTISLIATGQSKTATSFAISGEQNKAGYSFNVGANVKLNKYPGVTDLEWTGANNNRKSEVVYDATMFTVTQNVGKAGLDATAVNSWNIELKEAVAKKGNYRIRFYLYPANCANDYAPKVVDYKITVK